MKTNREILEMHTGKGDIDESVTSKILSAMNESNAEVCINSEQDPTAFTIWVAFKYTYNGGEWRDMTTGNFIEKTLTTEEVFKLYLDSVGN